MSAMTILVVDDEPRNIQVVSNILKEVTECRILYATNGEQALERVAANPIDLILLDMMMPVMDGLSTCRKLHEDTLYRDIPVIFLTAKNDEESLVAGFEAGAVDYISKPFLRRELIARVNTQLNLRQTQKRLNEELSENKELLKQYKEIVDITSIVTKTDLTGRITYTNDRFCEISGYDRDELIGKAHSIVRHPDVPKEVYKEMWSTIQNKKIWRGVVKNRKKDGGEYIVDSVVSPILDSNGNITEYISIRNDLTEIFNLKHEIEETQNELLITLGYVGESRSKETANHVRRVAEYAKILAEEAGLSPEETEQLWMVAPMHDIGKIGIPDAILNKPGKLDPAEFEVMKRHSEIGGSFFKNSSRPLLQAAATVAYTHHERWDGTGYPNALRGEDIPIFGRITAIADVFDALRCKRVYKDAWDGDMILEHFKEQRGKQFDPRLVDLMFEHIDRFIAVQERYPDLE